MKSPTPILIVGLGNPENKYLKNRHNAGFVVVNGIQLGSETCSTEENRFGCKLSAISGYERKILLAKPQTYMNNSGIPVSQVKRFFKIAINDIYVIHDELDFSIPEIRYKTGGGSAGHNGLKSIDSHIGKNYHRIRIGIGRPLIKEMVPDYVLSDFSITQLENLQQFGKKIGENITFFLEKQF